MRDTNEPWCPFFSCFAGGTFEALIQNDLLALQVNVLGPLDEMSHVSRRLDVLA
jgi:hypothetical protein